MTQLIDLIHLIKNINSAPFLKQGGTLISKGFPESPWHILSDK